jgi:hypothetical protein
MVSGKEMLFNIAKQKKAVPLHAMVVLGGQEV